MLTATKPVDFRTFSRTYSAALDLEAGEGRNHNDSLRFNPIGISVPVSHSGHTISFGRSTPFSKLNRRYGTLAKSLADVLQGDARRS